MNRRLAAAPALVLVALAFPAAAQESWTCTAKGLVSARYDGSDKAYVHLAGFSKGGRYKVTKSGNTATGRTANGTAFTCKKS